MLDILAPEGEKASSQDLWVRLRTGHRAYKGRRFPSLEDNELVEDMVPYVGEGYTTVKFKVGSNDGTDMERDARRNREGPARQWETKSV